MQNEELIHALGNCINHCNYCASACLDEDNVEKMVDCIKTDRACAEVCSSLNQLLAMGYDDVDDLVRYCMKTCKACADECGKHDHQHCQECAEACKKCAEACQSYLA